MTSHNYPRLWIHGRRLLALSLTAATLLSATALFRAVPDFPTAYAEESEEDLRDQQDEIAAKQEELEGLRNESAETLEEQEAEKDVIQQQIDLKMEEIRLNQQTVDQMNAKIEDANYQVALKEQEIAEKENAVEQVFAELQIQLRSASKRGTLSSFLQMLISVDDFTDYLLKAKVMQRLSERNEERMAELDKEMQVINKEKDALEKEKTRIEKEREPIIKEQTKLNTAKQDLDILYSEINAVTEQLNQDIDYYNAQIAQAEADQAALQEKIDELVNQNIDNGLSYTSGSMYNPSPACNYISSTYKFRWGKWHNGVDMCGSGCYGANVYAAEDGIVTYADWMSGYGWVVIIDHGTDSSGYNVTTLYAHCAELYVYEGEYVEGGESVIAAVGSSGNSTGPHLHFEVRLDGSAVDPLGGYLSAGDFIIDESL